SWSSEGVRFVEFYSHVALSYDVAMRLKHPLKAPRIDVCSEAETHRLLRKGYASRFLSAATAESGLI
ncbi:MAG TPA: hypothetical protein VEG60_02555, partial [Candidatus Binatia bacterium]|nr:hypothetical protein [Candidatus Binatia bacterium]